MNYTLPHSIKTKRGEKLTFKEIIKENGQEKLLVDGECISGAGPVMHTHFKQDEGFTVVSGKIGYEFLGEEKKFAEPGAKIIFKRGTPHRFWNAGEDTLKISGWVSPPNSIVFFLTHVYEAINNSDSERPEKFDIAYLSTRYKSEYDMPLIPKFVKKVIMPVTYFVGKITGKYKKFKDAPEPVK